MYQNALNHTNSGYGGMKAEEKTNYLNQSVITGYIKGISSYIPSSIKSSIKKQIMNSPVTFEEKDTIVGTYFDECFIQGEKHKILINCYNNGFQVWDLNHTDGVKELLSFRDGLTKFCKVLTNPLESDNESSSFYGKRPLLAVVSGEDNPKVTKNMVRIFSLQTTELISMYKFKSPIYNVLSNQQIILVVLKERIVGFNANDMSKIKGLSLPCYPSVTSLGVIALGSRWIAYTDYESSYSFISGHHHSSHYFGQSHGGSGIVGYNQNRNPSVPQNQTFSDTAVDVASDIAKEVAQKLYYFGDIGRKKVSSYLYPDNHDQSILGTSPNSTSSLAMSNAPQLGGGMNDKPDAASVIVVFDFVKQRIVSLIKPPHTHPISYLAFDPTGTLLFTSTTEGTKVNTYQIIPFTNSLTISSPLSTSVNSNNNNNSNNSGGIIINNSLSLNGNNNNNNTNINNSNNTTNNNSIIVSGSNSNNNNNNNNNNKNNNNNNINNNIINNNNNNNNINNTNNNSIINNNGGNNSNGIIISSNNNNNNSTMNFEQSYRHIYILKRGITNASIQGITTSENSKWVALTTSRGTTHIFAINPLGGEVDIHSHITRSPNSKRPIDYYSSVNNLTPSLLTINAMDRIKLGNDNDEASSSTLGSVVQGCVMSGGNACFIESTQPNLENLFVCSPTGQLILYELRPQRPPISSEMAENTLCLSITPVAEWDVCRKTRSPEYKSQFIPYTLTEINKQQLQNHTMSKDQEARWLYNVEITTHSQEIRAIWGVPQFTFRSSNSVSPAVSSNSMEGGSDVNFFDQDYPVGEVIKFEKRKNISPRIQDGYGGSGFSTSPSNGIGMDGEYKSGSSFDNPGSYFVNIKDEDDIEIIEKLNDAMKTPISKSTIPIPINNNNNSSGFGSNNSSNNNSYNNNSGSFGNRVGQPITINNGNGFNNNNNNNNNKNFNNTNNNNFNNSPETGGFLMKKGVEDFGSPNHHQQQFFKDSNKNLEKDLIPNPMVARGSGLKHFDEDDEDDGGIDKFTGLGDEDDDFPAYPHLGDNDKNKFPISSTNGIPIPLVSSNNNNGLGSNNPRPISSSQAPIPVLPNTSSNSLPTLKSSSNSNTPISNDGDSLPPPPVTPTTTTTTTTSTSASIPIPITKKSPKEKNLEDNLSSSYSSSSSTQSATSPTSPKPNLSSPPKGSSKKSRK
ncbi:hypothetical protein ACTFIU_008816 [Dictyostelium citrinum]